MKRDAVKAKSSASGPQLLHYVCEMEACTCFHARKNENPEFFPGLGFCRFENEKIPGIPGFF